MNTETDVKFEEYKPTSIFTPNSITKLKTNHHEYKDTLARVGLFSITLFTFTAFALDNILGKHYNIATPDLSKQGQLLVFILLATYFTSIATLISCLYNVNKLFVKEDTGVVIADLDTSTPQAELKITTPYQESYKTTTTAIKKVRYAITEQEAIEAYLYLKDEEEGTKVLEAYIVKKDAQAFISFLEHYNIKHKQHSYFPIRKLQTYVSSIFS